MPERRPLSKSVLVRLGAVFDYLTLAIVALIVIGGWAPAADAMRDLTGGVHGLPSEYETWAVYFLASFSCVLIAGFCLAFAISRRHLRTKGSGNCKEPCQ